LKRLEPYEGKLSRTVLRGGSGSNVASLPDYPTDADTLERVLSMLTPPDTGSVRLLDPCAGEGVALAEVKQHLGTARTEAFGIEVDAERAWHAKTLLDRVIHGDFQDTVITPRSFGLLWLNPPYGDLVSDQAATGEAKTGGRARLEKLFYQRAVKRLQPGGVMVLIVPYPSLDREFAGWIAADFEAVVAYRAPVATFKQAVVVGLRARAPQAGEDVQIARNRLGRIGRGEDETVLPPRWTGEPYRVPAVQDPAPFKFHAMLIDPAQLRDEIRRFPGLWPQFELHLGQTGRPHRRPLRALSRWHLALSLAAGQVSGVVRSNDGQRVYVVKGDTFKQKDVKVTVEESPTGRRTEIRTAIDVFVPVIRALDFTPDSPTFGEALIIQ
jgi:hypothetical protein